MYICRYIYIVLYTIVESTCISRPINALTIPQHGCRPSSGSTLGAKRKAFVEGQCAVVKDTFTSLKKHTHTYTLKDNHQ